jgi:hypothetical protein
MVARPVREERGLRGGEALVTVMAEKHKFPAWAFTV